MTCWYLLPLLPGVAVLTLAQAFVSPRPGAALRSFGCCLLTGLLIQRLNQRAAGRLQQKIDRLAAMEK